MSTARRIPSSIVSASPTSLSRGMKNVAFAASLIIDITPRAVRWRFSPSKVKGVVAKTTDGMPCSERCLTVSSVAPPPVPPPREAVITASLTPSRDWSIAEMESSAVRRAATTSPPAPRPESLSPPISTNGSSSRSAPEASVSTARYLRPSPNARRTPRAMAEPPPPIPMRSIEDESLI